MGSLWLNTWLTNHRRCCGSHVFLKTSIWVSPHQGELVAWPLSVNLSVVKPQMSAGFLLLVIYNSVQFSHSVVSDSLWSHNRSMPGLPVHHQLPNPWSPPKPMSIESVMPSTTSSSVIPFSSCPQSFPASGSFPASQFFTSGGQSIRASASLLQMNIQDWFSLELTGWISLQSKRLSSVFSSTTVQKLQFFGAHV